MTGTFRVAGYEGPDEVTHRIFAAVLVVLAVLACTIGLRYVQRD
ncbi:MAG TPA: hypothetical protein VF271_01925 [Rhodanobacteraceae bacterium]